MITSIFAILIIHFIADFLLQSDNMAINKSSSVYWLSVHVLVYTTALWFVGPIFLQWWQHAWWVITNGMYHFIVDEITSRVSANLWKQNKRHWFFVTVGLDQLIHYMFLFSLWWTTVS